MIMFSTFSSFVLIGLVVSKRVARIYNFGLAKRSSGGWSNVVMENLRIIYWEIWQCMTNILPQKLRDSRTIPFFDYLDMKMSENLIKPLKSKFFTDFTELFWFHTRFGSAIQKIGHLLAYQIHTPKSHRPFQCVTSR